MIGLDILYVDPINSNIHRAKMWRLQLDLVLEQLIVGWPLIWSDIEPQVEATALFNSKHMLLVWDGVMGIHRISLVKGVSGR